MMKKILLIAICLLFLCSKVNAVSVNNDYSIKENKISIKNNTFDMYVTFTNDKDAFSILNNKSHNLIEYIKNKYNYTDISSLNVDKYLAKYYEEYEYIDDNYPGEGMSLIKFYDIFENKQKNKELLNGVNDLLLSNSKIKDDNIVDLLPFDNKNVKSFSNIRSFDICRGQQYAINHATNPNKNEYKYFPTGDCANFASQILEKSGVKQVTSNSVLSGWWHKKVNKKHKQSNSWSLADVFARYMGIGYKTSNHEEFSKHLKSGDFIAVDFDSDGDWDHIGFLVNYNPNGACYGPNNCYNDYRVAQHTKNYNEWVTSSKNNWETLGNDGGTYARVRR